MTPSVKTAGLMAFTAAATAVLLALITPGCTQNQENSPISISHAQGRPALSIACSTDGATAYVADGRNVYCYQRNPAGPAGSWECILSQGERLELALQHDPREQPPAPTTPSK
jgi:hypothetical protein